MIQSDTDLIYANVPFSRLAGSRILITGGTGFVGRWLSLAPLEDITILNHQQYEALKWTSERWDYIIHLANVLPLQVIDCAYQNGATILYSSSGAVFDAEPGEYSRMKQDGEAELLWSGLPVKIARMFTFCGGWMKNHFAITNMIQDALHDPDGIRIRSTRTNVTRSYLYAADMAIWLWRILIDGQPGGVYEVGSQQAVTMAELAKEVKRNFSRDIPIRHTADFPGEPRPFYIPTKTHETMNALGVREYTPFQLAVSRTVEFYANES